MIEFLKTKNNSDISKKITNSIHDLSSYIENVLNTKDIKNIQDVNFFNIIKDKYKETWYNEFDNTIEIIYDEYFLKIIEENSSMKIYAYIIN